MVKRIASLLFVILLLLLGSMKALAEHSENVKDYLNYLNSKEIGEIQGLIENTIYDHSLDITIVITDGTEGKSSMEFADDYFDFNGFGVGDDFSGLLLLINMDEREVWISTHGSAIDIFTDDRISSMVDSITGLLSNGDFYGACIKFVDHIVFYSDKGIPSPPPSSPNWQYPEDRIPYRELAPPSYWERVARQITSPPVYIMAAIISIITTAIVSSSNKGKVTINNRTYEGKGSFNLVNTQDDYMRQTTTRVKISKDNHNGSKAGGSSGHRSSSVHRSSSGRSHGGGGGKF